MKDFKITKVEEGKDGVVVVAVEGQVGIEEAARVSKFFEELENEGVVWVIVSLKGVDFISTAGVGALLYAVGGARKRSGEIVFIEFSPKTKAVFEFLDLHDFIVTAPDREGGLRIINEIKSGARKTNQ
ncbi:MAG: STAS domain-containing protein [candidate division Zixibacteria bacterium]|nr:STAS domain-containing protein [candidate division Zixibacteria bacterium]